MRWCGKFGRLGCGVVVVSGCRVMVVVGVEVGGWGCCGCGCE